MKQHGAPWLITILALMAAFFPALKASGPTAAAPEETAAKTERAPPPANPAPAASTGQEARWKDLLRPFQDLLTSRAPASPKPWDLTLVQKGPAPCAGCEYTASRKESIEPDENLTISEIVKASDGFQIDFLIALIPDPIDSSADLRFDQGIEALQAAFVDQGYLPDRFWFPWKTEAGQQELARRMPGIWLFTRTDPKPEIKAILLVGENPKFGVQKAALWEAIGLEKEFMKLSSIGGPVRILGPSFSGSARSLKRVLDEAKLTPYTGANPDPLAARSSYQIVTGTATAEGLEKILGDATTAFRRTVVPDNDLQEQAFAFLEKRMGWDMDKVALLIESDTAYGQKASSINKVESTKTAAQGQTASQIKKPESDTSKPGKNFEIIRFPSGLSNIRTEWEKNNSSKPGAGPVEVPKSTLSLNLGGSHQPVDLVPEFSPLSPQSKDLLIANLLTAISRSGIRYVGILATDTRDKLFLAERIRQFAPDVVLFTFDNNLLYAHPEYAQALDGTLVLSSFPLFTADQSWKSILGGPKEPGHFRLQFPSEFEQGIFLATRALLHATPEIKPRIWISTVGNGALWPLASFQWKNNVAKLPRDVEGVSGKTHLQLWLFELVALALGWWLWRTARLLFDDLSPSEHKPPVVLLSLGLGALWVSASVLLVLGTIPFLEASWGRWVQAGLLTVLGLLYAVAIAMAMARAKPPEERRLKNVLERPAGRRDVLLVLLLWTVVVALPHVLYWLWIPDRPEFFYFRARRFSSGLSPVLSLLFWSAAVFVWVYFEIHRRLVSARRFMAWPYPEGRHPALTGCQELDGSCRDHLMGRVPSPRFWIVFAVLVLPPASFLVATIQPITEPRPYGWVFSALILLAGTLCAMSFYRFVALWLALEKLLKRLNQTHVIQAFKRVSPQVGWNPMKSFGWQTPSFNLLVLQAEKAKPLSTPEHRREIDEALRDLFEAERKGDLGAELTARQTLNGCFSKLAQTLAESKSDKAEDFLAVRLVAYIRHAFLHLHYSLNQSLAAALLVLLAVRVYAFEPKQFFSMCLWAFMIPAVFVTLWIFLEMDRNASLSAIGGTDPGKVTFNRDFFTNFFSYGLIPLFGILVSLFPEASRWLVSLINPLLRVSGVG